MERAGGEDWRRVGAGPVARVDSGALAHNLEVVRAQVGAAGSRVLAVVKADAYGHGLETAARALAGADGFAVARAGEALELRRLGVTAPVLVLAGWSDRESLERLATARIDAVLHERAQLEMLRGWAPAAGMPSLRVWLKVNTGMHRLGFEPAECAAVWSELGGMRDIVEPACVMTHFANADAPDDPATGRQIECFDEALAGLADDGARLPAASLANSAAVLTAPAAHRDWVRPGLMLYGASPVAGERADRYDLRPAMRFSAPLIAVRTVASGAAIGYGGTWRAPEAMRVGVVAVGYADGYPRHAPSGTPVLVNGRRAALAGRVSMDSLSIDLRGCDDARVGDEVTLWGEDGLSIEEVAEAVGTIPYELMTRLGPRVARETI